MDKDLIKKYIEILSNSQDLEKLKEIISSIGSKFESLDKAQKREFNKLLGEVCIEKLENAVPTVTPYRTVSGVNEFLIECLKDLHRSFSVIYTKSLLSDLHTFLESLSEGKTYIDLDKVNKILGDPNTIRIFEKFKRTTRIFCIDKRSNNSKAIKLNTGDIVIFETPEYLSVLIKCLADKLYDYMVANKVSLHYDKTTYTELFLAYMNSFYSLNIENCIKDEGKINRFYIELNKTL